MLHGKGVSTSFHCTAWSAPQLSSAQLYGFLARCRHPHITHPLFFSYSHYHAQHKVLYLRERPGSSIEGTRRFTGVSSTRHPPF